MNDYSTTDAEPRTRSRSGLVNALLGAAVMIFFSWIPFAPAVGGALAGYLEAEEPAQDRTTSNRGIRVGALAGAIATIPAAIIGFLVGGFLFAGWFGFGMMGGMNAGPAFGVPFLAIIIFAFVFVAVLLYHIGLGALGGWIGAELAAE